MLTGYCDEEFPPSLSSEDLTSFQHPSFIPPPSSFHSYLFKRTGNHVIYFTVAHSQLKCLLISLSYPRSRWNTYPCFANTTSLAQNLRDGRPYVCAPVRLSFDFTRPICFRSIRFSSFFPLRIDCSSSDYTPISTLFMIVFQHWQILTQITPNAMNILLNTFIYLFLSIFIL